MSNVKAGDLVMYVGRMDCLLGQVATAVRRDDFFSIEAWRLDRVLEGAGIVYTDYVMAKALRKIENPGDSVHDVRDILIPEHLREGETA